MVPQWIIEQKRDGRELPEADIRAFIDGYTRGDIPDYQMSALAMAIFFRGMSPAETAVLTDAMMRSGDVLSFPDLDRPTVDKHSTGGIGDKVSLPLAPLVAACGAAVPMISGRGLGITGGTLDKLESIPGYRTNLSIEEFGRVLKDVGCSIIGQTARLAPADKKLYALRDVTGTTPSMPLICASILSKKLAEGADSLVFEMTFGKGLFRETPEAARELGEAMAAICRASRRRVSAFLTSMEQPLGRTAGNALEVRESIETLRGNGPADTVRLTVVLGGEMLRLAGLAKTAEEGESSIRRALDSGAGFETFCRMVAAHGGDVAAAEHPERLPQAPVVVDVPSPADGFVAAVDTYAIGRVVFLLGGGRTKTTDAIRPAAGVDNLVKCGERVRKGDPLFRIHADSVDDVAGIRAIADAAVTLSDTPSAPPELLAEIARG